MSQINRPPIGLQSLLGSKNFGQNPSDLSQQVLPTVDLFPFWATQQLRFAKEEQTTAGGDNAPVVSIQVPEGETWAVISATMERKLTLSTTNIGMNIAIDDGLTGANWFTVAAMDEPLVVTMTNIDRVFVNWTPPILFWLPSGYAIRGINQSDPAEVADYALDLVYYKLEV